MGGRRLEISGSHGIMKAILTGEQGREPVGEGLSSKGPLDPIANNARPASVWSIRLDP